MTSEQIAIFIAIAAFTVSGVVINIWKRTSNNNDAFQQDGNTLLLFRLVIPTTIIASLLFYFWGLTRVEFPLYVNVFGYLLVVIGFAIRWVAVISLGKSFTVYVTIIKNHKLKTNGLYRFVRHPSYTGLILYYIGLGLMLNNIIALVLLILLPLLVIVRRIILEEKVLLSQFKQQYTNYQSKTWKLIPFLY
jgi:protein-S-isoprenylcysteine O-methyltransferase Ste14